MKASELRINTIHKGDCLELMKDIPDGSIDAIITDPPYGTTACKWDSVIDFKLMWEQLNRIIKPNGAIVLFGSEPFSSALRMSNIKNYKYDWVWDKVHPFNLVGNQPSRCYELISIFNKHKFNEQKTKRTLEDFKKSYRKNNCLYTFESEHQPNAKKIRIRKSEEEQWYKKAINILRFQKPDIRNGSGHPTQKPVALMEYLIKTYTNENETVLDFTAGSGTTGIACINTNRNYILMEKDPQYFSIIENRIAAHTSQLKINLDA
jgi:DNA modification methylase